MSAIKEVFRAIISLILAFFIFQMWSEIRVNDPDYIKYGVAVVVFIVSFLVLHFIGKEQ